MPELNASMPDVGRSVQTPRPLRLRMIGTSRNGQVIEFVSPRVTIGSAPNCVLRLRSANVRPLQCLIVREPTGVLVRSLAVDTLLNGHKFRDEILCRGDRLQVGPIALEVVDDGFTPIDLGKTDAGESTNPDSSAGAGEPTCDEARSAAVIPEHGQASLPDELIDRIAELEQRFQGLMTETTEQDVRAETAVEQVTGVEQLSVNEPPGKSGALPEGFVEQLAEWKRIGAQLEQERALRESTKVDLTRIQRDTDDLRDRCHQLVRSRTDVDDRLQALQSNVNHQLSEANAVAARLKAEFELRHAFVLIETQQLRCDLDALKVRCTDGEEARSELERCLVQCQERSQELEQRLQECTIRLSESEARWSEARIDRPASPPDEIPQEPSINSATSDRLQELMRLSQSFAARDGAATSAGSPHDEIREDDSSSYSPIANGKASVDNLSGEFDNSNEEFVPTDYGSRPAKRKSLENQPSWANSQSSQPLYTVRFLANQEEYQQYVGELSSSNPNQPDAQARHSTPHGSDESPSTYRPQPEEPARLNKAEQRVGASAAPNSYQPEEQATWNNAQSAGESATPDRSFGNEASDDAEDRSSNSHSTEGLATRRADAEDVFSRLSRAGIWKGIEAEASNTVETSQNPESSNVPPAAVAILPGQERAKAGETGEDDSIENYMQRLLERVRGDGNAVAVRSDMAPLSDSESPAIKPEPSRTAELQEPPVLTQSEYQPRSQAPEMNVNLAAMRAIANDSRKTNMRAHARRKWSNKSQGKFAGAFIGLGVAGISFYFLDTHTEIASCGFFAGCTLAAFWIWRAFHYRRQLFDSLQLDKQTAAPVPAPTQALNDQIPMTNDQEEMTQVRMTNDQDEMTKPQ